MNSPGMFVSVGEQVAAPLAVAQHLLEVPVKAAEGSACEVEEEVEQEKEGRKWAAAPCANVSGCV